MVEQHLCASSMIHLTSMSHKSRDPYNSNVRKLRPEKVFNTESLKGSMDLGLYILVSSLLLNEYGTSERSVSCENAFRIACISRYCDKEEHL